MASTVPRDAVKPNRAERAIATYKTVKGIAQGVLAVALLVLLATGEADKLARAAVALRHHASAAWSVHAAALLSASTTRSHVALSRWRSRSTPWSPRSRAGRFVAGTGGDAGWWWSRPAA